MRKRTLLLTLFIVLPLLLVALRSLSGLASPSVQAGTLPPVQEGPANVDLVSSSQTWDIVSKASFSANRVDVVVARPGRAKKVLGARFKCGTEEVSGEQKPVARGGNAGDGPSEDNGPERLHREVWSATFSSKCIGPGATVSVTLIPVDPSNKIMIRRAIVENTSLPQTGQINVRQIGNSVNWKVTFKDPSKGFNRVEIYVGNASATVQKVRRAEFQCQSSHQVVSGELKRVDPNVNPDPATRNHEVWSGTFSRKCSDGVRVLLQPANPRNRIVVKGGLALNTTRRTGPANVTLEAKSETFKITSKATFAANRVEVDVGTRSAAQKVNSASFVFVCQNTATKVTGVLKRTVPNTAPGPVPTNDEVWSAEVHDKCIGAADPFNGVTGGSVSVTLIPVDANNQLVIKKARVQNTTPPTDTPTPTPASIPTPTGTNGSCAVDAIGQPFLHRPDQPLWDFWTCTPSQNVDWNRVDVLIGRPNQEPKIKAIQFDCTSNHSKASAVIRKGHVKTATQDMELWSGEGFKEVLPNGNVLIKNCHGAVSVAIAMFDPTNHPTIKKAFFSHTGLPKPTPPKPPANGLCTHPDTAPASDWTCSPDNTVPPFNRIDIKVASLTDQLQLADLQAVCADGTVGVVDIKGQKVSTDLNGNVSRHEVWSADFPHKCQGDVSVTLKPFPLNRTPVPGSTPPQIIGVTFSNTTKPPANGRCVQTNITNSWLCFANTAIFFDFSRIDIWVGKPDSTQKVSVATFGCFVGSGGGDINGVFKGQKDNNSTELPLAEQWSADFLGPCLVAAVVLQPADPANILVIKKVVLGSATPTPTPTPAKSLANGACTSLDNIHQWSCIPNALNQQFTRVDISVGKAAANSPKLTGAIFVCLSPYQQAIGLFKRQKLNDTGGAFSLSDVWSANFLQPCTGEVRVFLIEVSTNNLPAIKKVVFS